MGYKSHITLKWAGETWSGNTQIYTVYNSKDILGDVRWYAPWRRYCFIPKSLPTVFDAGCLHEIREHLIRLTDEHKNKK